MPYIDWSPFFMAWELKGKYPRHLRRPRRSAETRAQAVRRRQRDCSTAIVAESCCTAHGVYGFFPANADGDDIVVYADETRDRANVRFPMLRQQWEREGQTYRSAAWPTTSRRRDRAGPTTSAAFAVTAGIGLPRSWSQQFEADHDDYNAIMAKALADRLAEAFAELLHERARRDWGYGRDEQLSNDDLIEEKYRGIRPAAGYPSCPDHTEKATLWDLLDVERATPASGSPRRWRCTRRLGQRLLLRPPAGALLRRRSPRPRPGRGLRRPQGLELAEVERWLAPNLGYDPDD